MLIRISPSRFVGEPMSLRGLADADYAVEIDGMTAGRLLRTGRAARRIAWLWTITGPYIGYAGVATSGDVEELVSAKTALRASFDGWLAWAMRQPRAVAWHG
jgi:hypothetical protein